MLYPTLHAPSLLTYGLYSHSSRGMERVAEEVLNGETADLFVDELLDFSNGCSESEDLLPLPEDRERDQKGIFSGNGETAPPVSGVLSEKDEFGTLHVLNVEVEGLESLEWLSHFVEDSFSDYSFTGKFPGEAVAQVVEQPCFMTPVQTKARTKRGRTGVQVWPVLSHSAVESSTSSSSSTTAFSPPKSMKQKRKVADSTRKCSHCGVTKTPQWRAGPLGSKTLCNACGVRFKSGRLLPEYRPAGSPTYSSELHSNNHRKVLEMRRNKEGAGDVSNL